MGGKPAVQMVFASPFQAHACASGVRDAWAYCGALAIPVQSLILREASQDTLSLCASRRAELDRSTRRVGAARKPVISNDLVLLLRSGKKLQWKPSTFQELAAKGLRDDQALMEKNAPPRFHLFLSESHDQCASEPGVIRLLRSA